MFRTNPDYIHEFDILIGYEDVLESAESSINQAYINSINMERKVKYTAMFENSDDQYILEEAQKNLFTRIGDGIKKLLKKIGDMIKNLFGGGKDKEFKDNLTAAQQALAQNPSLKDEFMQGVAEGKFDIKDINAFVNSYEEASKLLADDKIDPKTFKGKLELFKRKFDKEPIRTIRIKNILGAVGIGGLVYKTIADSQKNKGLVSSAVDRAYNRFHKMQGTTDENGEYNTKLAAFWEGTRTLLNANADETNQNNHILNFLNGIYKKISKKTNADRAKNATSHLDKAHRGDKDWAEVKRIRSEIGKIDNILSKTTDSNEIVKLQTRRSALEDRLYAIDRDIDPIKKINREADKASTKQNTEYAKRMSELDTKEKRLQGYEKKLQNKEKSISVQLDRIKNDYKKLNDWNKKNRSLSELNQRSDQLTRTIGVMQESIDRAERETVALNNEIIDLEQRWPQDPAIQSKKTRIKQIEKEIDGIKGMISDLHKQKDSVRNMIYQISKRK